jgi:SAM-dependent methyltransferase
MVYLLRLVREFDPPVFPGADATSAGGAAEDVDPRSSGMSRRWRTVGRVDDPDGYFGEDVAASYDGDDDGMFAPAAIDPAVDLLARLAGTGRALELGVGTGRIALPLAARGVPVHGIDLSRAMVARLRAKPGGDAIGVTIGDFATTRIGGTFTVVYLVFNTIMNLTTQDAQVDCFANAAAHLDPGGCFVIEVGVPDLRRLPPGQEAVPFRVGPDRWAYDWYDTATQAMSSNYVSAEGLRSIPFRYVWPAELDLMARLAGMRLRDRWAGWRGEPFTSESGSHVSVWEKP